MPNVGDIRIPAITRETNGAAPLPELNRLSIPAERKSGIQDIVIAPKVRVESDGDPKFGH